jgi:hypothetical protein
MGLTKQEKWARNKGAFDEIIGDPYGFPEPIQGHYAILKNSSGVKVTKLDMTSGTNNSAQPNVMDFSCDVDNAIDDGIKTLQNRYPGRIELFNMFLNTYFYEVDPMFNQQDRAEIEQIIGNILRKRRISPVSRYFTAIRK